jgi:hypothetical protein
MFDVRMGRKRPEEVKRMMNLMQTMPEVDMTLAEFMMVLMMACSRFSRKRSSLWPRTWER